MDAGIKLYIPQAFRSFQGFSVVDLKESTRTKHLEIVLEKTSDRTHHCARCGHLLGAQEGRYWVEARHLRLFDWTVSVTFWREKRWCPACQKTRSELIEFLCPTSPHMTLDMAWWINRLTEITSVLAASKLEGIDKMSAYKLDHYILARMAQGYEIPTVTHLSVDEVYARSPKQKKPNETRDDLFITVITDQKTRKVIWVSQGRKKDSLDRFFQLLGPDRSKQIKVVAIDQHEQYRVSVNEYAPQASVVWDRFHLVQVFNELANDVRKEEAQKSDPEGKMGDLIMGKYKYIFLSKAENRSKKDRWHIDEVMKQNARISKLEIIKERLHQMFDCSDAGDARIMLAEIYEWSFQINAMGIVKWVLSIVNREEFWNYFEHRVTTSVSEGINRSIKGLKWQAYGYKNMAYFGLKILQKCGYLNHRFFFAGFEA